MIRRLMIVASVVAVGAVCASPALDAQIETERAPGGESATAMAYQDPRAYLLAAVEEDRVARSILQAQSLANPSPDDLHARMSTMLRQELGDDIDDPEFLRRIIAPMRPSVLPVYYYYRAIFSLADNQAFQTNSVGGFNDAPFPEEWERMPAIDDVRRNPTVYMGGVSIESFALRRVQALLPVYANSNVSFEDSLEEWCQRWSRATRASETSQSSNSVVLQVSPGLEIGPRSQQLSETLGVALVTEENIVGSGFDQLGPTISAKVIPVRLHGDWHGPSPFDEDFRRNGIDIGMGFEPCSIDERAGGCVPPSAARSLQHLNGMSWRLVNHFFDCDEKNQTGCLPFDRFEAFGSLPTSVDQDLSNAHELGILSAIASFRLGVAGGVFSESMGGATHWRGVCFIPDHLASSTQDGLMAECISLLVRPNRNEHCPYRAFFNPEAAPPSIGEWNFFRLPEVIADQELNRNRPANPPYR